VDFCSGTEIVCSVIVDTASNPAALVQPKTKTKTQKSKPTKAPTPAPTPTPQEDEDGHDLFNPEDDKLLGLNDDDDDDGADGERAGFAALRRKMQQQGGGNARADDDVDADEFFGDNDELAAAGGGEEEGVEEGEREAAVAAAQRAALQRLVEEYYKLDYEDNIGGLACRFRYRHVSALVGLGLRFSTVSAVRRAAPSLHPPRLQHASYPASNPAANRAHQPPLIATAGPRVHIRPEPRGDPHHPG